jgi:hypothetical protein
MANDNTTSDRVLDAAENVGNDAKIGSDTQQDKDQSRVVSIGDHEKKEECVPSASNRNNDFVIRDGFPALRLAGNIGWNIDDDEPIPNYLFRVEPNLLSFSEPLAPSSTTTDQSLTTLLNDDKHWECIWKDATTVFTARTRDDSAAYSAGTTYFCPAQMKPRCALEEMVLSIYKFHTKDLPPGIIIPEQSGAEWWTLVMEQTSKDEEKDEEEDDDEVGMHFDADYGLEDQAPNLMLHPRLATITYLTSVGAPTLILDQQSPPPADTEKKTLQGSIRKGWLSHPRQGKHISFDGRLLHGAPSSFLPAVKNIVGGTQTIENGWGWTDEEDEPPNKKTKMSPVSTVDQSPHQKRITLLVNIWINHCPLDAEPLEDDLVEQLNSSWKRDIGQGGCEQHQINFSLEGNDTSATNDLPIVSLQAAKPTSPNSFAASLSSRNDQNEAEPAGEEEVVIGGRLITISYGATMEAFQAASEMAAKANLGCAELELGREVIALSVGEVVDEDDDTSNES